MHRVVTGRDADAPGPVRYTLALVLYAAYGSNLDPLQMSARCPHSPLQQTGWLTGWRITFGGEGWDGALPTVVEDPDSQVFVALYDITESDESALDSWESADSGLYRKVRVRIDTLEGEAAAWVYVLDDFEGGTPSARTLGLLADAAEAAGAPGDYVAELRNRPCTSGW
ncbi:gamma-glutamylcyclotransferase [Microlunatus ginsengisoli]|uniref:Gamma-glutamylcyclotransferase n=1 Tax=Microlunatus ginsengisoli TaxID=363863 RepID=A0ABP7A9G2_9ACTN